MTLHTGHKWMIAGITFAALAFVIALAYPERMLFTAFMAPLATGGFFFMLRDGVQQTPPLQVSPRAARLLRYAGIGAYALGAGMMLLSLSGRWP